MQTDVYVTATAYDERTGKESGGIGCGDRGCLPSLAYDGTSDDGESRWSCSKDIVPNGGQCEITFTFDSPQDVRDMHVAFWKGDERSRSFKVRQRQVVIALHVVVMPDDMPRHVHDLFSKPSANTTLFMTRILVSLWGVVLVDNENSIVRASRFAIYGYDVFMSKWN